MKQILALLLLTTGCKKAPEAFTADNATQDSSANETLIEADQLWEDRGNKDSLTQALSKYEEAFKADISNREVGYKLTPRLVLYR